ncbi:TonB family protein [Xanthobacteraceae bacterium A53D]
MNQPHHHEHRILAIAGWWLLAGVLAFAAHAGAVYVALYWHKPVFASDPPAAAIMIELAPLPVAPPSQTEDVAPGPEMVQAPEPVLDAPDLPEEVEPPPPPPPEPDVVEKPEEKLPELPPAPPMAEAVLPTPRPVIPDPPKPQVQPRKPEPPRERRASRRPAAPTTSAAPRSEAPQANTLAAPNSGAFASSSVSPASWRSSIMGHLNRFKRYPPESRSRREEGVARVRFSIDRSGRVLSASLTGSSGHSALDSEAVEMVRRASPFPPPPANIGGSTVTFTAPVDFNVR